MKNQLVKPTTASTALVRVAAGTIERRMFALHGYIVMLDSDLAKLYRVPKYSIRLLSATAIAFHRTSCSNSPPKT
jgi:hypothetical protein